MQKAKESELFEEKKALCKMQKAKEFMAVLKCMPESEKGKYTSSISKYFQTFFRNLENDSSTIRQYQPPLPRGDTQNEASTSYDGANARLL